jgi:hypothetical protein
VSRLPGRRLADAGGEDVSHDDFIHFAAADARSTQRLGNRDGP